MEFVRGSVWRKWDLHVHGPTRMPWNQFKSETTEGALDRYCRTLEESDVAAFGITDYFGLDAYWNVATRFRELYPDSNKLLLPNMEVRLPEAVNATGQSVNLHLLFNNSLTEDESKEFLGNLKTRSSRGSGGRKISCAEIKAQELRDAATVSLDAIDQAFRETFGSKSERSDHFIVVTSGKGDGIRPGGKASIKRKADLTDEIDKFSDAFFADPNSKAYYMDVDRYEVDERAMPKPVFDGSDAHNFDALDRDLGKWSDVKGATRTVTWIKSDPTYSGLLQTLVEPDGRVQISELSPLRNELYKTISSVVFRGSDEFPSEIHFNPMLNAVIGTRSSGKSALIAYMAHAVDSAACVEAQIQATGLPAKEVGPAAGLTWGQVQRIECEVRWASGSVGGGEVK